MDVLTEEDAKTAACCCLLKPKTILVQNDTLQAQDSNQECGAYLANA